MNNLDHQEKITEQKNVYQGIGVSSGIIEGIAYLIDKGKTIIVKNHIKDHDTSKEIKRFRNAVVESISQLKEIKQRVLADIGEKHVGILDSHIMMLEDEGLKEDTIETINRERINAEWALEIVLERLRKIFTKMDNEYLKAKKVDIDHIGNRIINNLIGSHPSNISDLKENFIVVSHELAPSEVLQIKQKKALGFIADTGGETSHIGIMAKALGIPAVLGLKDITKKIKTGDHLIIDGKEGIVAVEPEKHVARYFYRKKDQYELYEKKLFEIKNLPAKTTDGYKIDLMANVESADEINSILNHGAEGIGLYRTEYLFMNREDFPTEEEHFFNYKNIVEKVFPKSVTIRTLDLGGDKMPILENESNPALGLRAIRYSLKETELFKSQIRGILRASNYGKIKIMYPLISTIEEIKQSNHIMEEVKNELISQNIPFDKDISVGIMIETPSAAILADQLAKEVDFFSIGTNDLIQYTLAVDRTNENVSYLYQPMHPSILRLLKNIIASAAHEGIQVSICGEMGADPLNLFFFIGMGPVKEISMDYRSIPYIKKLIRMTTFQETKEVVRNALTLNSSKDIKEYIIQEMKNRFPAEGF